MAETSDKTRIEFVFSPEAYEELNELKTQLGSSTSAQALRSALTTLGWIVSTIQDRKRIIVRDANGSEREVIFPLIAFPVLSKRS